MKKQPEWQERFQSNTTRVAFTLSLTQAMLEFLCACSDDVYWDRRKYRTLLYPDNWIATEHGLVRRGLVKRKPPKLVEKQRTNEFSRPPWELTPAGRAVVELLKVGGIFIEAEAARDKLSKRKGHR